MNASRKTASVSSLEACAAAFVVKGRPASCEERQLQQQEKVAKLIQWFAKAAARHAEAIEALQEEAAAVQVECLDRFYAAVQREGGLDSFLALLDDEDPTVSGMAAVYAMREAPQRCSAALARVAQLPGLIGFRAKAALELWESGEWPR